MRRLAVRVAGAVLARRGLAYGVLIVVNAVHAVVHGTPLDGGSLDASVVAIDQFCIASIMMEG